MFDTYFGGVEYNYSILNVIDGHLRSINAISRECRGQTLKLFLFSTKIVHLGPYEAKNASL